MFTKLFALSNSKHNVKKYSKCLYVCFYAYKLVLVYLGVSFTHANEWNTSCQSFDDEG